MEPEENSPFLCGRRHGTCQFQQTFVTEGFRGTQRQRQFGKTRILVYIWHQWERPNDNLFSIFGGGADDSLCEQTVSHRLRNLLNRTD